MPDIIPNLWFDTQALEAAEFYCSIFPNSKVLSVSYYGDAGPGPAGTVMTVEFELDGKRFTGINGGPQFPFTEAVSFLVECEDQDEVDHYWDKLTDGGREVQCGWLADRYGLSWQVVPKGFEELMAGDDANKRDRVMKAMLGMVKLDVAALQAAADGVHAGIE
ncbi:MAG TPA: VOC family protein [Acidimicrobiales bacterium]|jgi:predicted 3-demethylubiquinone-9 3-methyltransferase (glyoxalase superfamily)|nr:VOC family protein [Acidimicrobiales bacterium]